MLSPLDPTVCLLHWNSQYQNVNAQPMLFSPEKEILFQKRFEEGYDIQDEMYVAWIRINNPERCLSVDSSSSVSANSDVKVSSNPSSIELNDVLSEVLVRPKPKEISRRKRKAGINQRSVCLTDDNVLSSLKEEVQRKKDDEQDKLERKQMRE